MTERHVLDLCDRWDALSKGESPTTQAIRQALAQPDQTPVPTPCSWVQKWVTLPGGAVVETWFETTTNPPQIPTSSHVVPTSSLVRGTTSQATSSRRPPPYGDDVAETSTDDLTEAPTSSRFGGTTSESIWHYPETDHPATSLWTQRARSITCPTCGAPPRASCVNQAGDPLDSHVHLERARSSR